MQQLDIFAVLGAFAEGATENRQAYEQLGRICGIPASKWEEQTPIGRSQRRHNPLKIRVRWFQHELKKLGLLEAVAGRRGHWQATTAGKQTLKQRQEALEPSAPGLIQLGFSTELGMALWADCRDAFSQIEEQVHLVLTSPPYPLANPRDYGGPARAEYVDWLCACLEPLVKRLAPGASLFLNVSNDIFEEKSPARSLYRERLVIALHERLGLHKMDTWIWDNPTKAPGPMQWASIARVQVNTSWEPIYWFTNDPQRCFADNRRVLRPHTERHQRYIDAGGATKAAEYGDGANRRRVGSFSNQTPGSIPRNLLRVPHRCPSQVDLRRYARQEGVPIHSATMPLELAEHIVRFATEVGQLVADPFGGWLTTALAAERNFRRWVVTERMRAFLHGGLWRMHAAGVPIDRFAHGCDEGDTR